MAKIYIDPTLANSVLEQEESLGQKLNTLAMEVDSVRSGLRYKIAGQQKISQCLREAAEQITKESQGTYAMCSGLTEIIAHYERTELENVGRVAAVKASIQQTQGSQSGTQTGFKPKDFEWWDLVIKELANLVGPAGFLFTGGKKWLDRDRKSAINEIVKSLGKAAKVMIDKPKAEWKDGLLGLTMITEDNLPTFAKGLGDFSSIGNAVGTLAKWGTALADSLFKNLDEFGDDSWGGRFWAETGLETVIKVAEGAAIGAGVAAAAVAIFGSAPAVAIGAAAVGVTMLVDWGLDNLVSWATNGSQISWVEAVSDMVCDTGEKIINAVGDVATKAWDATKKAADTVADAVSKGWNNLKEGATNLFSGCKWGEIFA